MVQAALVMGVSERQCYRVKARVKKSGAKGVVHGNRGRPSDRKVKEKIVKRIIELAQGKYQDFNDHHLTDKLESEEKIELSREKVRRILRGHGIQFAQEAARDQAPKPAGTKRCGGDDAPGRWLAP